MDVVNIILLCALSYAVGAVVSLIVAHPLKSFDAGYEAAKEIYSDWDRGFKDGVKVAHKVDSDFEAGFEAGWNGAFNTIRSVEIEDETNL